MPIRSDRFFQFIFLKKYTSQGQVTLSLSWPSELVQAKEADGPQIGLVQKEICRPQSKRKTSQDFMTLSNLGGGDWSFGNRYNIISEISFWILGSNGRANSLGHSISRKSGVEISKSDWDILSKKDNPNFWKE
uniref:Uncharacterized protein n=1 Tax=Cannabis sativa TaxID=3483 RepID=A0A803Q772_CANSA